MTCHHSEGLKAIILSLLETKTAYEFKFRDQQ